MDRDSNLNKRYLVLVAGIPVYRDYSHIGTMSKLQTRHSTRVVT